jgi:hypothetical protein
MSTHNMLALTLHWLRQAPSFRSLAAHYPPFTHYHIRSTIQAGINILYDCAVPALIHPIPPTAPSSRIPSLQNVKLIIDSTFIPLPAAEKDPKYYHPKSPTKAAMKVEITCDLRHRIVNVSDVVNGSEHDMKLVRHSGVLHQMNAETKAIGDKGYIGKLGIITPARKKQKISREAAALQSERERAHELQTERAAIENINSRVKQWAIAKHVWPLDYSDYVFVTRVLKVVCALVNLTLDEHPIRAGRLPLEGR